jgi:CRP-like cAMP-binding protein
MMARCEFLRRVPLLQPLTNEQITKVAGALAEVELPERSYVITQGDFGDTFYIIEVRVCEVGVA